MSSTFRAPDGVVIREMEIEDISPVAALEAAASTAPWSEISLLTYFLRDDTCMLIAREDAPEGRVLGFAALLTAPPDSDVLDITVDAGQRRRGIGEALLSALARTGSQRGVRTVYLEVRQGNVPALHLYRKLGFAEIGLRRNYYSDPVEDGIVMELKLREE